MLAHGVRTAVIPAADPGRDAVADQSRNDAWKVCQGKSGSWRRSRPRAFRWIRWDS